METPTVRVTKKTHVLLRQLAEETGAPMVSILDEAVRLYRRKLFFDDLHAAYEALEADPEALAAYEQEERLWEVTLADGIDDDREAAPEQPTLRHFIALARGASGAGLVNLGRAAAPLWAAGGKAAVAMASALRDILEQPELRPATLGTQGKKKVTVLDATGQVVGVRQVQLTGPAVEDNVLRVQCVAEGEHANRFSLALVLLLPLPEGKLPFAPPPAMLEPAARGRARAEVRLELTPIRAELDDDSLDVAEGSYEVFLQALG